MDAQQYHDWMDFTGRMARRIRPAMPSPRRARLASAAASAVRAAMRAHDFRRIVDWDAPPGPGDVAAERIAIEGLAGPSGLDEDGELALCCVKAGFDVAVSPSDGVVGSDATLGLVRRMYPEGMPPFVRRYLESTGVEPESGSDDQRVWL